MGTGLGLSIVRGIVTALAGEIAVESRLGQGTTFRVVLPPSPVATVVDEPTPPPMTPPTGTDLRWDRSARTPGHDGGWAPKPPGHDGAPKPPAPRAPPRPRGRVLVIDDEPALAAALARSIERDYEVVVLSSGREGLERLRADTAFDVILCDLIMPQVTGMDIFAELSRTAPALAERVVFMTGGTFTTRTRDFLAGVKNPALDKPFDLSTLSAILRARTRR